MEKKLWFKAKRYGFGWTPCSWEGWTLIILFAAFQVWNFLRIDSTSHSNSDTIRPFIIQLFLSFIILFVIASWKGEKLGGLGQGAKSDEDTRS
jgi:uncharacterized membrane protein